MAENEQEGTGTDTGNEALESEAREMGWVPKDEFKGEVANWRDAKTFVEHGRHVLPILRKNNERLINDQAQMRQQIAALMDDLKGAREDFSALQEYHQEEVVRRTEELRKQLKEQIKLARQDDDVDAEIDATDALQQLNSAVKSADSDDGEGEPGKVNGKSVVAPQMHPELLEWMSRNQWYSEFPRVGADLLRSQEALNIGAEIKREQPTLAGRAFYAELDRRLAAATTRPGKGKVEGSKGGSTQSGGNGRTYADLPAEAKAVCDKNAKRFVRENGQFKTVAEYRKHYIQELEATGYFQQ